MPIKYALFENNATSDPNDFRAVVQITESVDLNQLATELAAGSTFSKAEVLGLLEALVTLAEQKVANGARVNIGGMSSLWPTIKGVFDSADDSFDTTRHGVAAASQAGARITKYVRANATVEKDIAIPPSPVLIQFRDIGSGTSNDQVTPGNIGELTGSRLKFDDAQADEGAFFIETSSAVETKVDTV